LWIQASGNKTSDIILHSATIQSTVYVHFSRTSCNLNNNEDEEESDSLHETEDIQLEVVNVQQLPIPTANDDEQGACNSNYRGLNGPQVSLQSSGRREDIPRKVGHHNFV
jgi:hypothetical protein